MATHNDLSTALRGNYGQCEALSLHYSPYLCNEPLYQLLSSPCNCLMFAFDYVNIFRHEIFVQLSTGAMDSQCEKTTATTTKSIKNSTMPYM